jgi:hypothetical protein
VHVRRARDEIAKQAASVAEYDPDGRFVVDESPQFTETKLPRDLRKSGS